MKRMILGILAILFIAITVQNVSAASQCSTPACHQTYYNAISAKLHSGSDGCTYCHPSNSYFPDHISYVGIKVNKTTCTKTGCHAPSASRSVTVGHANNNADCTQCHFANTTRLAPGLSNNSIYEHDHNFTIEKNYYNYSQSGIPFIGNNGTGKGMFPYYSCTLVCHTSGDGEDEVISWNMSKHANSRLSNTDGTNQCAKCKSPPNFNGNSSDTTVISAQNWQGIQCRVCHNLHNNTYNNHYVEFYNSTLTGTGKPVYQQVQNVTVLCENCHISEYDRKYAGTHKTTLNFTCVSCHGNKTLNAVYNTSVNHTFMVMNTSSRVTGCEICHNNADHISAFSFTEQHTNKVTCWACHDQTFTVNATNYSVYTNGTGLYDYGIYKDPATNNWTTYKINSSYIPQNFSLHNINGTVTCNKCHNATTPWNGTTRQDTLIVAALTCATCHPTYSNAVNASNHNKTLNADAPYCTDCHAGYEPNYGHTTGAKYIVNESNTCRNCHIDGSNGFKEAHTSTSDCTKCHFANTTQTFSLNTSLFNHDHNLSVEHSYYEYTNGGGMPLAGNVPGTGVGMFPQYTCSLTCHATRNPEKVDKASSTWLNSSHADSRFSSYDSKNNCAICKSPLNYNDTLTATNPVIAIEDWKGIQCRVCHNLHNRSYSGISGNPVAFYNATASSYVNYSVYDKVSNNTDLCEKCHQPGGSHDSKFAGPHKATSSFTCTSCHMNDSFSKGMHDFQVKNTTSSVTGCEVCHNPANHTFQFTSSHTNKVDCVACHDQTFTTVNATGYAVSSDNYYGLWKETSTSNWTTAKKMSSSPATWPLHNISKSVTCAKCHGALSVYNGTIASEFPTGTSGYYVGNSTKCAVCHPGEYAVWRNTSHTSKIISRTDAQLRGYPDPANGDGNWSNVSYVIGGHWKVRYVDNYGYILTNGTVDGRTSGGPGLTQYNVETQTWSHYNRNTTKAYNCGHCHTTGYISNVSNESMEPWNTLRQLGVYPDNVYNNSLAPGFTGWWAENSIGCEACHGQGGDHVNSPSKDNIKNASYVRENPGICGDCHSRPRSSSYGEYQNFKPYPDGVNDTLLNETLYDDSPMPTVNYNAVGGHHEQWEDWKASVHSNSTNASNYVTCVSCHGGHNITDPAYAGGPTGKIQFLDGKVYPAVVNQTCTYCHLTLRSITSKHTYYNTDSQCITCHMPVNRKTSNIIDLRSHWFNTSAIKTNKNGEIHGYNFQNLTNLNSISSINVSCKTCHSTYYAAYNSSSHNKTVNPSAPACTDCHMTGYTTEVINNLTTCINCHANGVNGFYQRHTSSSDCTSCHFANTTASFSLNTSRYSHDHNLTVESNYYYYNISGLPLTSNLGTGKGMFPYYSCTLACHNGEPLKIDDAAESWLESAHARSRHGDETYDSKNSCAKCKSPPNYNASASSGTAISEADWQGIQCRVCHNLHDLNYPNNTGPGGFPIAFFNSTKSSQNGYATYDQMTSSTQLCENCHTGNSHDSKFAGTHKDSVGFNCTNCHMNSTFNNELHKFEVKNTTSGVEGCKVCHTYPGTTHSTIYTQHSNVTCEACHDNTVSRNSSDYVVNSDSKFGIYKNSSNVWVTYKLHGTPSTPQDWPLHNISKIVSCDKCHGARSVYSGAIAPAFSGGITYNTTQALISGYNLILVLLNPEPTIYAQNLTYPASGGIPGVTKVLKWNSTGQKWDGYRYISDEVGYLGTNFELDGYKPYFVLGNSSTVGQTYTFRGRK